MPALVISNNRMAGITVTPNTVLPPALPLNASASFAAMAWNQLGRDMPGQTFTWSIDPGGVGIIDSDGTYHAGPVAGTASIRATSDTVSGVFEISVANTPPTLLAAAAATAPTLTDLNLSVAANDDSGESTLTYAWTIQSAPVGALPSFTLNGTNSAKNTTVHLDQSGDYAFLVTISDGSFNITNTVNVTVAPVLTALTVTPATAMLNLHQSTALTVSGSDQFGHTVATLPALQWSETSGPGSVSAALYTADATAGTAIVSAAAGGVNGSTSITITNAAPTVAAPASTPTLHIAGTTAQLTVLGADDGGETNLTYSWSTTASPAGASPAFSSNGTHSAGTTSVTFDRTGNYTFLVTISDGTFNTTSSVQVIVDQTLTSITVAPASVALHLNQNSTFSATAFDQFGIALSNQPAFTWSLDSGIGTVTSNSYFSGPTAGAAVIRASSGNISGTAAITVTNAPPTLINPAATSASTVTGTSASLSALGADDGGDANLIYTWSVITAPAGATPLFSTNTTNSAKNTTVTFNRAGAYTFAVSISDGHAAITSQISLTVSATLSALTVTPSTSNLITGDSVQLSATAADQFAIAIANPGAIIWSIDSGGVGTLGSAGLYSAIATGNATARATIGGISSSAFIQVSAPLPPVALVAQTLLGFTDLVVTGTSNYDTINVQQSGNVITVISHGISQMITGSFQDIVIHAGPAGSLITVGSSVSINTRLYGGSGSDDLRISGTGAYNSLVSLGGGVDSLTGNGTSTYYWADNADAIHSVAAEVTGGRVHQLASFYQPWSTDPANANYVPLELAGQNLQDPTDSGTPRRNSLWSLFGTLPQTTDVRQGGIGDCYVLAAIGSLALSGPERIYRVAADLGDGTYIVRFKRPGGESYVRVDADLANVESAVSPSGGTWIPVIEKAYAFYRSGSNTYASLNSGWMFAVLTDLGFSASNTFTFSSDDTLSSQILTAIAASKALSIGTGTTIYSGAPLITSHAYVVLNVFKDATNTWMIQIRNVWGYDGTGNDGNPADGILTMTFAQLRANCSVLVNGF